MWRKPFGSSRRLRLESLEDRCMLAAMAAWWKMDDGAGVTLADSSPTPVGGSANDGALTNFSGSFWNANLTDSASVTMPYGLYFTGGPNGASGAGTSNPFVELSSHVNDFLTLDSGTLSVWFRLDVVPSNSISSGDDISFVGVGQGDNGAYTRVMVENFDNTADYRYTVTSHAGTTSAATSSANAAYTNDGKWHNLVYTSDGASGATYLDGQQVATGFTSFLGFNPANNFTSMHIGVTSRNSAGGVQWVWSFRGTMADMRVYDDVLAADEIDYLADPSHFGDGRTADLKVTSISPADGAVIASLPATVTVNFSETVLEGSVAASDLTVNGQPATGFSYGGASATFNVPGGLTGPVYTIHMAENAVQAASGSPLTEFTSQFTVPTAPTVTTAPPSTVGANFAEIGGGVTSTGSQNPTVTIYWGDNDGGVTTGAWDHSIDLGVKGVGDFAATLGSLQLNTQYFYRAQASNLAGSAWSPATQSFTTAAAFPSVLITESMADNDRTLDDQDGDSSDWIELYNAGMVPVDLGGWHLTDDAANLSKWTFPTTILSAGQYMVVFASSKDRAVSGAELHTNFSLSDEGEYLAVVQPNGSTIASSHGLAGADYPTQLEDYSHGLNQDAAVVPLVSEGAAGKYFVPSNGTLEPTWTTAGFAPTGWTDVTLPVGYDAPPDRDGLIGYWNFDTPTELGGTVPDESLAPALHDGTLVGDAIPAGGSLALDGAGDYLDVGSPTNFSSATQMTVSAWVNSASLQASGGAGLRRIMEYEDVFYFWMQDDKFRFTIHGSTDSSGISQHVLGGSSVVVGEWIHVLATFDGTTGRLYVNGQLDGQSPLGPILVSPHTAQIGARRSSGGAATNFWDGSLDDVALWDRALSETEIAEIAAGESPLHLNDISGQITTSVEAATADVNSAAYVRIPFTIAGNPADYDALSLNIDYDDGFVAYLNDVEIARRNAPASPTWNSAATADLVQIAAEQIDVSSSIGVLQSGSNVLAIRLLNASADDGDIFVSPKLSALDNDLINPSDVRFFSMPTPGERNSSGSVAVISDRVEFSQAAGTFASPFSLFLSTAHAGATIHYTLDGSIPTESSPVYGAPIDVSATTQVRARAFAAGFEPSRVAGASYVLVAADALAYESALPILVLENFNGGAIPNKRANVASVRDGANVFQVPYQSQFMAIFDSQPGANSLGNSATIATDAGARVRGASSANFARQSLSIETWDVYYDDGESIEPFGMPANSDWVLYAPSPEFDQALIHNSFIYELSQQMGFQSVRFQFVDVFINTNGGSLSMDDYAGLYIFMEPVEAGDDRVQVDPLSIDGQTGGWMVQSDRYQAIPVGGTEIPPTFHTKGPNRIAQGPYGDLVGGDQGGDDVPVGYNTFFNYESPKGDRVTQAQMDSIQGWFDDFEDALYGPDFKDPALGYRAFLDVNSLIDHLLLNNITKNRDALQLSTFLYRSNENDLLHFGPIWDFDRAYDTNTNGGGATDSLDWGFDFLWLPRLAEDVDFMQQYQDRYQVLRDGAFADENVSAIIAAQMAEISPGIAAATGSANWAANLATMETWLHDRLAALDGLYLDQPQFDAPSGPVSPGFALHITAAAGDVYYTTDGSDPRLPGGGIAPSATLYDTQATINATSKVVARAINAGNWSGPNEVVLTVGSAPSLAVTEIYYNPPGSSEATEFLELQNVGGSPLDIGGFRIAAGVGGTGGFVFPEMTLAPGEFVLIVSNIAAFEAAFGAGFNIAGQYEGNLSNGSDRLWIVGALDETIQDFTYFDNELGWPAETDGDGFSLVPVSTSGDYNDPANWRSSSLIGGSPGAVDPAPSPGDFNGDGVTTRGDLVRLVLNFSHTNTGRLTGDANRDFATTLADLALVQRGIATSAAPSPTPADAAIAALAEDNASESLAAGRRRASTRRPLEIARSHADLAFGGADVDEPAANWLGARRKSILRSRR